MIYPLFPKSSSLLYSELPITGAAGAAGGRWGGVPADTPAGAEKGLCVVTQPAIQGSLFPINW